MSPISSSSLAIVAFVLSVVVVSVTVGGESNVTCLPSFSWVRINPVIFVLINKDCSYFATCSLYVAGRKLEWPESMSRCLLPGRTVWQCEYVSKIFPYTGLWVLIIINRTLAISYLTRFAWFKSECVLQRTAKGRSDALHVQDSHLRTVQRMRCLPRCTVPKVRTCCILPQRFEIVLFRRWSVSEIANPTSQRRSRGKG